MTDILTKLSTYNLFNYLLPGVLFAVIGSKITGYDLMQDDLIIGFFVYYLIGLVISRVGSLVIEPALKWLGFLQFAEYKDYLTAAKIDNTIELLCEVNNMYRTLASMFLLLLLLRVHENIASRLEVSPESAFLSLLVMLACGFLFAYRKQTTYITKRIKRVTDHD